MQMARGMGKKFLNKKSQNNLRFCAANEGLYFREKSCNVNFLFLL
jgi:hypothetical protein